jgi:nicotinate-nucleotide adenylyltransferase
VSARCILLFGGSFDPVHNGHLALAHFCSLLCQPDELRLIPAGRPWQKPELATPADHRVAMLKLAFADFHLPVEIDEQEIKLDGPSYTITTLRNIRAELGDSVSLVLTIGADQLHNLPTWREWQQLFNYAHLCVVRRLGFSLESEQLSSVLANEIVRRRASAEQIRSTPHGLMIIADNFLMDVSATSIRQSLHQRSDAAGLIPAAVLDYIHQQHLYEH